MLSWRKRPLVRRENNNLVVYIHQNILWNTCCSDISYLNQTLHIYIHRFHLKIHTFQGSFCKLTNVITFCQSVCYCRNPLGLRQSCSLKKKFTTTYFELGTKKKIYLQNNLKNTFFRFLKPHSALLYNSTTKTIPTVWPFLRYL